jgi:hypothetical protein
VVDVIVYQSKIPSGMRNLLCLWLKVLLEDTHLLVFFGNKKLLKTECFCPPETACVEDLILNAMVFVG